jgi:hypothetical protein
MLLSHQRCGSNAVCLQRALLSSGMQNHVAWQKDFFETQITCPSDCTYRRFYLSIRLTTLTENFTFPSDWLHLPKILPFHQTDCTYRRFYLSIRLTALTEDVTCPSDCTYRRCYLPVRLHLLKMLPVRQTALNWRCYLSVKLHLLKIGVACNVNPRR